MLHPNSTIKTLIRQAIEEKNEVAWDVARQHLLDGIKHSFIDRLDAVLEVPQGDPYTFRQKALCLHDLVLALDEIRWELAEELFALEAQDDPTVKHIIADAISDLNGTFSPVTDEVPDDRS